MSSSETTCTDLNNNNISSDHDLQNSPAAHSVESKQREGMYVSVVDPNQDDLTPSEATYSDSNNNNNINSDHESQNSAAAPIVESKQMDQNDVTPSEVINIYLRAQLQLPIEIERLKQEHPTRSMDRILREAETKVAFKVFIEVNDVDCLTTLDGRDQFDFHGLSVKRARIIAEWMITKILPLRRRIHIITGHGKHQRSLFKEGLHNYIKHTWRTNVIIQNEKNGLVVVS
jgi:hypothetical protein